MVSYLYLNENLRMRQWETNLRPVVSVLDNVFFLCPDKPDDGCADAVQLHPLYCTSHQCHVNMGTPDYEDPGFP